MKKESNEQNQIPRRARMELWKPSELSVYNVMQEVEKIGADPKLTEVIILLSQAKDALSDYFDINQE